MPERMFLHRKKMKSWRWLEEDRHRRYDPQTSIASAPPFSFLTASHADALAKSLQSCPSLCDPIDGSPPGSAVPGIFQARTLEWVAIIKYLCVPMLSFAYQASRMPYEMNLL